MYQDLKQIGNNFIFNRYKLINKNNDHIMIMRPP
jgi:hypothetical protein